MLVAKIICPPLDGKIRKERKEEFDGLFFVHQCKVCPLCDQEECKFLVVVKKKPNKEISDEELLKILENLIGAGAKSYAEDAE